MFNVEQRAGKIVVTHKTLMQDDKSIRVLLVLDEVCDLTQRELAGRLGISLGGLNYCLKALVAKGLVEVQNFNHSNNKFGYIYLLTPAGLAQKANLTGEFLERKRAEYEALREEIEFLSAHYDGIYKKVLN